MTSPDQDQKQDLKVQDVTCFSLRPPLLQRWPERGYTSARSNHDHRRVLVCGKPQTSFLHPQGYRHFTCSATTGIDSCCVETFLTRYIFTSESLRQVCCGWKPLCGSREANHEEQRPRRGLYNLVLYWTTATRIWSLPGWAWNEIWGSKRNIQNYSYLFLMQC